MFLSCTLILFSCLLFVEIFAFSCSLLCMSLPQGKGTHVRTVVRITIIRLTVRRLPCVQLLIRRRFPQTISISRRSNHFPTVHNLQPTGVVLNTSIGSQKRWLRKLSKKSADCATAVTLSAGCAMTLFTRFYRGNNTVIFSVG